MMMMISALPGGKSMPGGNCPEALGNEMSESGFPLPFSHGNRTFVTCHSHYTHVSIRVLSAGVRPSWFEYAGLPGSNFGPHDPEASVLTTRLSGRPIYIYIYIYYIYIYIYYIYIYIYIYIYYIYIYIFISSKRQ